MREVANFVLQHPDVGESGTPEFVNLGRGASAGVESGKAEGESGGRGNQEEGKVIQPREATRPGIEISRHQVWEDSEGWKSEKEGRGCGWTRE